MLNATPAYQALADFSRRGRLARAGAYFSAGWLSLIGLKPELQGSKTSRVTVATLLLGIIVLAVLLAFLSHFLVVIHPIFALLGPLTLERAIVGSVIVLNVWRFLIGRSLMKDYMDGSST